MFELKLSSIQTSLTIFIKTYLILKTPFCDLCIYLKNPFQSNKGRKNPSQHFQSSELKCNEIITNTKLKYKIPQFIIDY